MIATPLRGADGEIYALAQGNLVVGGAAAGGSKVQINHLSAGRIPQGAQVERSVPTPLNDGDTNYARLINGNPRYAAARAKVGSAVAYAAELQKAGYATDPAYARKLSNAIHSASSVQRT